VPRIFLRTQCSLVYRYLKPTCVDALKGAIAMLCTVRRPAMQSVIARRLVENERACVCMRPCDCIPKAIVARA